MPTELHGVTSAAPPDSPEQASFRRPVRIEKPLFTRPVALTRPSNDNVTRLVKFSFQPQGDSIVGTPAELTPQVSQQRSEKKIMTSTFPPNNKWRIIALCMWSFCGGYSDAAPGALLPTIEKVYDVSYSVVSLIWMANAVGFILVAVFAHKIQQWLGREKSVPVGCLSSVIMFAMVASGGPFPLIVTGFFFGGLGFAIVLAQSNVFLSKLDKNSKYLSFFHAGYGLGATISPLIATAAVERGVNWNYCYLVMLVMMIVNGINTHFAFRGADEDLLPWDHDETEHLLEHASTSGTQSPEAVEEGIGLQDLGRRLSVVSEANVAPSEMRLALKNRITWLISLFVLCYQGSEVSLGGWIVSYLVDYRHTSTSYGYVLSGFWGGLTVGRLMFTRPLHKWFGARRSITGLVILTITAVALAWVNKNTIVLSVFVSIAGALIGPLYPLMITDVAAMLPRKIQVVSMTIMTAFGLSGGAIFPFLTGLLAESAGTYVVLPIFIASYSVVLILWLCLPNVERKGEIPDSLFKRFLYHIW